MSAEEGILLEVSASVDQLYGQSEIQGDNEMTFKGLSEKLGKKDGALTSEKETLGHRGSKSIVHDTSARIQEEGKTEIELSSDESNDGAAKMYTEGMRKKNRRSKSKTKSEMTLDQVDEYVDIKVTEEGKGPALM